MDGQACSKKGSAGLRFCDVWGFMVLDGIFPRCADTIAGVL